MRSMLKVEEIGKTFPGRNGEIKALDNVNFKANGGELIGVLGPNGAGKTTLVKIICGLVSPDFGRVEIAGTNPWENRSRALRCLSAVLEGTRNLYWPLTVRENLEFFASLKGEKIRRKRDRMEWLIDSLGLEKKVNVTARNLSRGMQQKLALAVALVVDVPLLVLDEPTLGLDVESSLDIRRLLQDVVREEEKTILLTTHDMNLVRSICPRIVILNRGRIVTDQRVDKMLGLFKVKAYKIKLAQELTPQQKKDLMIINGVSWEKSDGNKPCIYFQYEDMREFYRIIEILRKENTSIGSIEQQDVDLEKVFLQLTGRRDDIVKSGFARSTV